MPLQLPFSEFRLSFATSGPSGLPRYAGSAWRGALGHALKRTVCVVRGTPCADCMLYRSCAYPYIFETPPPPTSEKMRRYTAAPHPFVIAVEAQAGAEHYTLGLTLFGKGHQYLPYLIHALEKAGDHGIGKNRQVFRLNAVEQRIPNPLSDDWEIIYAPGQPLAAMPTRTPVVPPVPDSVRVDLETPLRLRRQEHLVTPKNFRFGDLFSALLRRFSMLTYFHTDAPLETDFASLTRKAETTAISEADLSWWEWTRYSTRQHTEMQMGGLLGSFQVDGTELDELWPYLWLGQWTHAGKAATMGLGRYRVNAASLQTAPVAASPATMGAKNVEMATEGQPKLAAATP